MLTRITALLFLFLPILTMAQNKSAPEPYAAQWAKADSLLAQSLPASARKIVEAVYAEAARKNEEVPMLKAQLYLLHIHKENEEAADSLNIARAEEGIAKTGFPIKAVWQSIAAQLYWQYYQVNRYKILSRTTISPSTGEGPGGGRHRLRAMGCRKVFRKSQHALPPVPCPPRRPEAQSISKLTTRC